MIEARLFAYRLLDAIREDDPFLDLSAELVPDRVGNAEIVCKSDLVLAGSEEVAELALLLGLSAKKLKDEGAELRSGELIMTLTGPLRDILKAERVMLNVLSMASGIATTTRRVIAEARKVNPGIRVAATRKTAPLLRYLQKKAVMVGGGDPHRFSLSDAILIKDNHVRILGLEEAIRKAKAMASFVQKIEVEVSSPEDAVRAASLGVDIVMLDNFSPQSVRLADSLLREGKLREKVMLEASGLINEQNVVLYAPYVDVISLGMLTHSFKGADISLEVR
ncbi:MAG: carboxylating nicotinate-nucleotide diphosphorylase [Thermoprotei archaeon]